MHFSGEGIYSLNDFQNIYHLAFFYCFHQTLTLRTHVHSLNMGVSKLKGRMTLLCFSTKSEALESIELLKQTKNFAQITLQIDKIINTQARQGSLKAWL